MKKAIFYLFAFIMVAGVFTSCTMRQKATPLAPINAQVNFNMDDLEYIGEVTGNTVQSYVFGIPYGGRQYHSGILLNQQPGLGLNLPQSRGLNNALYDALMQSPDADFVLPVSYETVTEQQFLGRKVNLTVKAKAFRIKSN